MDDKLSSGGRLRPSAAPPAVTRALRDVSDSVTTWRKLRGLTQAQVAARAGVGVGTVRRLESGDGGVSLENVLRVARALGLADAVPRALDPYATDIGRLRADEQLPVRVRPRDLGSHRARPSAGEAG